MSTEALAPAAPAGLPPSLFAAITLGGVVAAIGAYWDLAWHTDVGRDAFFSPPHLLLYSGITMLLGAVGLWALSVRSASGSWLRLPTHPLLLVPALGATLALAAAPVDELWHHAFGRDSVVWSPPHMVAVVGLIAFAAGILHAVRDAGGRAGPIMRALAGGFVAIAVMFVVVEYETDVPQFPLVWYLPLVAALAAFAFSLLPRRTPSGWTATQAAAAFTLVRVAANGFLVALDHSTAVVPPLLALALAFDLARRYGAGRVVTAAALAAATVLTYPLVHAHAQDGLWFSSSDLVIAFPVALLAAWAVLAAMGARRSAPPNRRLHRVAAKAAMVIVLAHIATAKAHDPGQGAGIAPATLHAEVQADAITLTLTVSDEDACSAFRPQEVVARRAGRELRSPLERLEGCAFAGTVRLPAHQRWFVYTELDHAGELVEAWIPAGDRHLRDAARETEIYAALPPRTGLDPLQVAAGVVLYALALLVLGVVVRHMAQTTGPRSIEAAA